MSSEIGSMIAYTPLFIGKFMESLAKMQRSWNFASGSMLLRSFFVLMGLLLAPLTAEEKTILQYLPNMAVKMVHTIDAELWHPIPNLQIATSGKQTLTASVLLQDQGKKGKSIDTFPIRGEFRLQNIEVSTVVEPDNKVVTLDIRQAGKKPLFAELNKLINLPLRFEVDKQFSLAATAEIAAIAELLPPLKEIVPARILEGFLAPIFVLAARELQVGDSVAFEEQVGVAGLPLASLKYDITDINADSVTASYHGEIRTLKVPLQDLVKKQDKRLEGLDLSIGGKVEGQLLWQRTNALICTESAVYSLYGGVKIFGMELPVTLTMKVSMSTFAGSVL